MAKLPGSGIRKLSELRQPKDPTKSDLVVSKYGVFRKDTLKMSRSYSEADIKAHGEVFKFQAPLFTTEREPKIMVYNEDRSWEGQVPMTEDMSKIFAEKGPKFFMLCVPDKKNQLILLRFVGDQDW